MGGSSAQCLAHRVPPVVHKSVRRATLQWSHVSRPAQSPRKPPHSCPLQHKKKKVKMDAGDDEQEVIGTLSVIAQPLAGKKLTKKLLKVVKKAAASKILRRGVKEVVKVLRKADGKFKGWVFASCAMAGWRWYCWTCPSIFLSPMWEGLPCDRAHMPHRPQASASPF